MKKQFYILICLCCIGVLAASCSKNEVPQNDKQEGLLTNSNIDDSTTGAQAIIAANDNDRVDVDLTLLSDTMIYVEMYNILINPDDYMGKTIKMSGTYYASYYDEMDQYYHYVLIEDATACCTQGLEFLWNGEPAYPDDYPEEQTRIEVMGVFGSYEELGQTYYCLTVDTIEILDKPA